MTTTEASVAETVRAFPNAITAFVYDAAMTLAGRVRGVLERFFSPTPENKFRILRELTNGKTVFTERLDRRRLAAGWAGLPVAGVWEGENGLITVWRECSDLAAIMSR